MLFLVRHAKAGSRHDWEGDDHDRPLSKAGLRQAEALAARLGDPERRRNVSGLISSSYLRCRETLGPLSAMTGVAVEVDERLAEGSSFESAIELLGEVPDEAVLCSHGDVIPETISALQRRGCLLRGEPDWRKATVWVLDRRGGEFVDAHVWAPPE